MKKVTCVAAPPLPTKADRVSSSSSAAGLNPSTSLLIHGHILDQLPMSLFPCSAPAHCSQRDHQKTIQSSIAV